MASFYFPVLFLKKFFMKHFFYFAENKNLSPVKKKFAGRSDNLVYHFVLLVKNMFF